MLKLSGFFEMACDLTGYQFLLCTLVFVFGNEMHAGVVPSAGSLLKDWSSADWRFRDLIFQGYVYP